MAGELVKAGDDVAVVARPIQQLDCQILEMRDELPK
jgi:hypothetical protein